MKEIHWARIRNRVRTLDKQRWDIGISKKALSNSWVFWKSIENIDEINGNKLRTIFGNKVDKMTIAIFNIGYK
jgi:hypothetical protein